MVTIEKQNVSKDSAVVLVEGDLSVIKDTVDTGVTFNSGIEIVIDSNSVGEGLGRSIDIGQIGVEAYSDEPSSIQNKGKQEESGEVCSSKQLSLLKDRLQRRAG
ncbi:hypothetical protein ACOSQ3_025917 [Xanthoceras sorbifolium]